MCLAATHSAKTLVYTVAAGHKLEIRELVFANTKGVAAFFNVWVNAGILWEETVPAGSTVRHEVFTTLVAGDTVSVNTASGTDEYISVSGIDVTLP